MITPAWQHRPPELYARLLSASGKAIHEANPEARVLGLNLAFCDVLWTESILKHVLYVNPKPGEAEPTNGTVKDNADLGVTDTVLMFSTGAFSMDELPAGETFQSVLPIKK